MTESEDRRKKVHICLTIVERRKNWIGHIIRNNTWIMTMTIEVKPARGRLRRTYCTKQNIMLNIGKESFRELKEVNPKRIEKKN